MFNKTKPRWRLFGVLVALVLAAAACSSSEVDDAVGDAADTVAGDLADGTGDGAMADCESTDDVTLQLQWFAQSQFAGYYAAVAEGIYDKYCLNVTIAEGGVDIVPQQQLGSGAADYAISWVPKALGSRAEGIDIVNVAQIFQRSGTLQVSFKESGINSPADFAGKNIGSWGFGNEFELLAGAHKAGLDENTDFTIVGQNFDMLALINGEIDAAQAMTYNEYAQVLETINPETGELFTADDLTVIDWNEEGTAMLQDAIWADGTKLGDAAYDDQTTRFIAASMEGWIWCRDNADACVNHVLDAGSTLGATHQTWQLNEINKLIWPSAGGIGIMDQGLWDQTIEVATSEGVLAEAPDDGAFTTKYAAEAIDMLGDMDTTGDSWSPTTVVLTEGGE